MMWVRTFKRFLISAFILSSVYVLLNLDNSKAIVMDLYTTKDFVLEFNAAKKNVADVGAVESFDDNLKFRNNKLYGQFPKGFVWGVASAAYQIEGSLTEGGMN